MVIEVIKHYGILFQYQRNYPQVWLFLVFFFVTILLIQNIYWLSWWLIYTRNMTNHLWWNLPSQLLFLVFGYFLLVLMCVPSFICMVISCMDNTIIIVKSVKYCHINVWNVRIINDQTREEVIYIYIHTHTHIHTYEIC